MKFELESGRVDMKPQLRSQIERRSVTTFHRLANWIHKVTIYVEDMNGPRGGKDKQCRVVIVARGIEPVVITETDETIYSAASSAIRRAGVVLTKRIKQRRNKKTKSDAFSRMESEPLESELN